MKWLQEKEKSCLYLQLEFYNFFLHIADSNYFSLFSLFFFFSSPPHLYTLDYVQVLCNNRQ